MQPVDNNSDHYYRNWITFKAYEKSKDECYKVIKLKTLPDDMKDRFISYATRNRNVKMGKTLCSNCDGTGNSHYTKYKKCDKCNGTGEEK